MHEPTVTNSAFSCPHCGAYTTQYWYNGYVKFIREDPKTPGIPPPDFVERIKLLKDLEPEKRQSLTEWGQRMRSKALFVSQDREYNNLPALCNLFLSQCYNCERWAVWVNEDLVYPPKRFGAMPNQDLPPHVLAVVEEGRAILNSSPKGAAALLRLAIQMLCKHLGQSGENLNEDIANLVKQGLNPIVQRALDVVRVIGNESVHPGVIDLNDNKDVAVKLFDLINIIAEQMITHPKHVDALYEQLPEAKRNAIKKRDE
ncbi:MAG: DUF4145 domain-containing protein [Nitrospirota bacterium]|nr:DUF4145 domain-containing protein [Nitrospirota bacterium]